jgi:hypothetical protein
MKDLYIMGLQRTILHTREYNLVYDSISPIRGQKEGMRNLY